ncbi:MAG: DUF3179 domain-containing protein [Alphaproteobacteria bacterium]
MKSALQYWLRNPRIQIVFLLVLSVATALLVLAGNSSTADGTAGDGPPRNSNAIPADQRVQIDRWASEGWLTDFGLVDVDLAEIRDILGRDRIPAIDAPQFAAVEDDIELPDQEPVIALEINGDARAYPLRIMMWHEIVNDFVGGEAVTVTYCPLCNSALVFNRVVDGQTLDFGTSGKLRFSDLVMYDRQTHTWWQQFTGEALIGTYTGTELEMIPSRLVSWAEFREDHPNGRVLIPNDDRMRQYWQNPYAGYDTAYAPFLFDGPLPNGLQAMERVVLVKTDPPIAVTLALVEDQGLVEEDGIFLRWNPGQVSALDANRIADGRDVGGVEVFRTEEGVEIPLVHDVTFAFAVNAFEPLTSIRTE